MESLGSVALGGALIGFALASLRILTGRVMSVSTMAGSVLGGSEGPAAASLSFMAGVFIAPAVWTVANLAIAKPVEAEWSLLVLGGLLVGFGVRLAETGLVATIWGTVQRSGWAAITLGAIAAGLALSSLAHRILGGGGGA
jgi:uncharacterized membrane protein YedE/YeeE